MKVKEKILLDQEGLQKYGPINIVIFGDSVSHGSVNGYNDYENVYWNILKKKLNKFRDYIPVNMINASIGGTTAHSSVSRMETQVFPHNPDLVIICFGLNDVNGTLGGFLGAMEQIFDKCLSRGTDAIFMTPNMLNTYVADDVPESLKNYAAKTAEMQNGGKMDEFMCSAIKLAESMGISVCDCYSKWKELSKTEDTTLLLANRINHPISSMHQLFADELYNMLIGNEICKKSSCSTMFKED